jgi:hypothetical protein
MRLALWLLCAVGVALGGAVHKFTVLHSSEWNPMCVAALQLIVPHRCTHHQQWGYHQALYNGQAPPQCRR